MAKNVILLMACLFMIMSCRMQNERACVTTEKVPVDKQATDETKALYNRLFTLLEKGIMVGHQDALAYGHGWYKENGRSDVKDVTGDYPAVVGWDVGHIEIGTAYNLDSVYFSDMKRYIRETNERGGITTISWHGNNIVTGKSTWDCERDDVVKNSLPGGTRHMAYLGWLDRLAAFFLDLKDHDGRLIPVVFRMYHEHTGAWFWWGSEQCTPEEYKQLWRMTFDYLREKKNVHNLLYCYSPSQVTTQDEYLERYPGDEYVDVVAYDCYMYGDDEGAPERYREAMRQNLKIVTDYAAQAGKIATIGETGMESVSDATYFTRMVYPVICEYPIAWVLFWRNAWESDKSGHFYVPYKGHPAAGDFNAFVDMDDVLMNRDIRECDGSFVTQKNGQFFINEKPYYYIGTNFWYGAILGSEGAGGNRERLHKELDFMKANGITNLRVLVGADGPAGQAVKVRPTLQLSPGVYNDTIFDGLDYLLYEMGKRDMHAVLFLNNSWEWSGGYGQYLEWAGQGTVPEKGVHDWPVFVEHVAKYAACEACHELFFAHVKHVMSRTNRYTHRKYTDDPTIMSWQVGNEPRAFSEEAKPLMAAWIQKATALMRALDGNHLISVGSEGSWGCEMDMDLFEQIHADPNVDYLTMHIWPKNWSWIDIADVPGSVDVGIEKTNEYMRQHITLARKLNKPVVMEEFGFPRDNHTYTLDDPTTARDRYYANVFKQVAEASKNNDVLAGCNCWAWGGFGRPAHLFWQPWDDYVGDPSQEEQGLNSVFDTDSTIKVIKTYAEQL